MAGFVHILPKIGLKQPSIFFRVKKDKCAPLRLIIIPPDKSNILIRLENKVLFSPLNVPENCSELCPLRTKLNKG